MAEKSGGMDRREFLRRSAIVGGTVAWMTPVIQSLTPPAYAHVTPGSSATCCQCVCKPSPPGTPKCSVTPTTSEDCTAFCSGSVANGGCGNSGQVVSATLQSGATHGYQCGSGNCVAVEHS
jgi:hypothetical protein